MRKVYVGGLPDDIRESEVKKHFGKFGPIVSIDLKYPPRPPAFCFIEYEYSEDAEDAIRDLDGTTFCDSRIRVEPSGRGKGKGDRDDRGRYGDRDRDDRGGYGGYDRRAPPRNTGRRPTSSYVCEVFGLPRSASWQDLKDHMRTAGGFVGATDILADGTGTVEFSNADDLDRAIRKLDGSEFRNNWDSGVITVKARDFRRRSRSRSRSPPRRRRRSFSRSRSRGRRNSRSRSRSPPKRRSRSRSASRSRSRSQPDKKQDEDSAKDRSRSRSRRSRSRSASPKKDD